MVYSTRRFVVCLTVCRFVLLFFGPFSIAITSLGEERANLSAIRTFVRFVLVWICRFPLPLGVWEGRRFVIVALPGFFSYLFFCENWLMLTHVIIRETKIWACLGQINSVKLWRNLPISNPKPDLHNISAHTKFGENRLMLTQVIIRETKIWACLGQITPSKLDENCPLAIPNQISTISMHIPSFVKTNWC